MQTMEKPDRRTENAVERNLEAARRLFRAVEHRDREGVMATYDENIVINEAASLPYGGEYRGHEGALRHGLGFRTTWDRFQPRDVCGLDPWFVAQGDHVVAVWRQRAENTQTGQTINLPAVSIYRFANGKIVDSRMLHFDTAALLDFLGGSGR